MSGGSGSKSSVIIAVLLASALVMVGVIGAAAMLILGSASREAYVDAPSTVEITAAEPAPPARQPARVELDTEAVPRHYKGTFVWDSDRVIQRVELRVEEVTASEDLMTARGIAKYLTDEQKDLQFEFRISPDGAFRMFEFASSAIDFVTDGSHVGTYDPVTKAIRARWTSENGQQGTLTLDPVL